MVLLLLYSMFPNSQSCNCGLFDPLNLRGAAWICEDLTHLCMYLSLRFLGPPPYRLRPAGIEGLRRLLSEKKTKFSL